MLNTLLRASLSVLAATAALCASQTANAQAFPSKPVRVIVQYPAGGALDTLVRKISQLAAVPLGQQLVMENRPGASGLIAFEACAKAAPDGYTMCLGTGEGMSFNPALFPKLPYDPAKDFAGVVNLVMIQGVILASGQAPYNTIPEMVAAAKARPGTLNWASFGAASNPHVFLEWIKRQAGVDITHVPYKGSTQTIPALMSNEAQLSYVALGFVLPQIRAGKLKALAVTTTQRLPQLPDVPTLAELGLDPGFQSWMGLFAPAATPRAAIDRLNAAYVQALKDTNLREKVLAAQAFEPIGNAPAEFDAFVRADQAAVRRVVQTTGIRLESDAK